MASLSGLGTKQRARRMPLLWMMGWLALALAIAVFAFELVRFSQQDVLLGGNVTVAGVNVSNLTPREAAQRWERAYAEPITLWYSDSPVLLDPASVGFQTNQDAMMASVRATNEGGGSFWGRFIGYLTGHTVESSLNVNLVASYQELLLRQFLADIATRYDRPPGPASYDVQTLTLRPGSSGYILDQEAAFRLIDNALRNPDSRQINLPVTSTDGLRPDITALRDMIIGYLDSQGFIFDGQSTVASVFVMDLQTGAEVHINSDIAFSAASTVKASIMVDYFRNLLFEPTQEEAYLMVESLLCSNNSSSNLIMQINGTNDIFTGIASVTNTMQYLGMNNSYLTAPLYLGGDQVLGSIPAPTTNPNPNFNTGADPYNQTTTEDLGTLFSMIYDCAFYGSGLIAAYPNGEITQQECRYMLEIMSANDLERLLQGGIPQGVPISHKNGWLSNVHGDAGIVFPPNGNDYVIAVYVWEQSDFFNHDRAWPLIEGISRATWNYFNPNDPMIAPRTDLGENAEDCALFRPPFGEINLNNINAWRGGAQSAIFN